MSSSDYEDYTDYDDYTLSLSVSHYPAPRDTTPKGISSLDAVDSPRHRSWVTGPLPRWTGLAYEPLKPG